MNTTRLATVAVALLAATSMAGCANKAAGTSTAAQSVNADAPTVTIMVGGLSKQIYLPFMLAKQL
ncbi:MAG: hypothetical protein ABI243_02350, partial [Lapillicoccus sp.]